MSGHKPFSEIRHKKDDLVERLRNVADRTLVLENRVPVLKERAELLREAADALEALEREQYEREVE